jgi:hypothetical protein
VAECVKLVRDKIGPVAAFKLAVVVDRLPKTRSGKILRGTMVKIADGEELQDARHHRRPGDPRRELMIVPSRWVRRSDFRAINPASPP